jgi:tetratricopeptide (TPR) repeat protein
LGEEGECCKHVVATALAWLARKPPAAAKPRRKAATRDDHGTEAIRQFIDRSDKQTLAEFLLAQAERDPQFAAALQAAALRGSKAKPAQLKALIQKAFTVSDYVDYRDAYTVVDRAGDAAGVIENAIDNGNPRLAAELAQYALELGADAINHVDDSDGGLGDVMAGIARLHVEACEAGALPEKSLARSVLNLQLADEIGVVALEPYLAPLGKDGLAEYRKLARREWKKLPVLTPDSKHDEDDATRYVITGIMKTLARLDDDVDTAVDILKHDLRHAHNYLEIATTLAKAQRYDEALRWAEDGRKLFPAISGGALDEFTAAEYHRRGRHGEAIALHWERFENSPTLPSYQTLKTSADHNHAWAQWRGKALAHLEHAAAGKASLDVTWGHSHGATLIQIHLWEGNPAHALAAARAYNCALPLWLELAAALEPTMPDEAIRTYQQHMNAIISGPGKGAYHAAGELIAKLNKLMTAANRKAEYTTWLAGLRLRHKAKRNFMQVLATLALQKRV